MRRWIPFLLLFVCLSISCPGPKTDGVGTQSSSEVAVVIYINKSDTGYNVKTYPDPAIIHADDTIRWYVLNDTDDEIASASIDTFNPDKPFQDNKTAYPVAKIPKRKNDGQTHSGKAKHFKTNPLDPPLATKVTYCFSAKKSDGTTIDCVPETDGRIIIIE